MKAKSILSTLLYSLSLTFSFAQTATVKGTVKDASGKAIEIVQVVIKETNQTTLTDSTGTYTLKNVKKGDYTLVFMLLGFEQEQKKISVKSGELKIPDIALKQSTIDLKEVQVTAMTKAQQVKETAFNVNAIETKKFENTNADVNRILNQSTGVRIRETGGLGSSFNFYLSGLSGKAVKFFIDGQPMEDYGSVFNLNNFPVNMIERVEVYKGAVPVSLGNDALGGAVNIITKKGAKTFLDASYSYGSFNTHRTALTGQWRDSKSGFTIKPQVFHNYSDNNYKMYNLKTIKDKQSAPYVGDFKRFLNAYESYLGDLQVGFTQKKWADRFFVGFAYGEVNQDVFPNRGTKDLDGSFRIITPDGARQYEKNYRTYLQYAKNDLFVKGLDVNLSASYNKLTLLTVDTLRDEYNWEGKVIYTNPNLSGNRITKFNQEMYQYTTGLSYQLKENHLISGSLTWSRAVRQNALESQLNVDYNYEKFDDPQEIDKKVIGLAYQYTAFDGKLQTILSGKLYNFFVPSAADNYENEWSGVSKDEIAGSRKNLGYGLATRYKVSDNWLIKASYEKAYRLPEVEEAFGDGKFILPNLDLLPENSHNINLGTQLSRQIGEDGKINTELGGFYRLMQNRIFVTPPASAAFYSYYNIDGVTIIGFEADLRYSYKNKFSVGANATFQDVRNDVKYLDKTTTPNFVYRDRMYNTPFFFGNADASYTLNNLTKKNLNLTALYNAGYVSEFFLNYPSIAKGSTKSTIPTQFVQDIAVTATTQDNRYSLTIECRNFLNALAYDNIAMQKPGRAFYAKFRYFLTKK